MSNQQNTNQKPPNWNQLVNDQLINLKKRTAQIKGETMDTLTEVIAEDFKAFSQIAQQLAAQIEQRDKTIEAQGKELEGIYQGHPEIKIANTKKETVKVSGKK